MDGPKKGRSQLQCWNPFASCALGFGGVGLKGFGFRGLGFSALNVEPTTRSL